MQTSQFSCTKSCIRGHVSEVDFLCEWMQEDFHRRERCPVPFPDITPSAVFSPVSEPQEEERSLFPELFHCRTHRRQPFQHRVTPRAWRQSCCCGSYRCPRLSWELSSQKDSTFSWPLKLLAIGLELSFFVGETGWRHVSAVEGLRRAHRE